MSVLFGLGGGTTTVNIISMTALHCIMTPLFVSLDIFLFDSSITMMNAESSILML